MGEGREGDLCRETLTVGAAVGLTVGVAVGDTVGVAVGSAVGDAVGTAVGLAVGSAVGPGVGSGVAVSYVTVSVGRHASMASDRKTKKTADPPGP
jgi:hypothetical protein